MPTAPSEPAKLAIGTAENPAMPDGRSSVSASIAPERRAGGDAERKRRRERVAQQRLQHDAGRGQRRADQAPASTRGSRAMKKICASAFSANGIDESKTRQRLIDVDPTSGASRHTMTAADAEEQPRESRYAGRCSWLRRLDGSRDRNHGELARFSGSP